MNMVSLHIFQSVFISFNNTLQFSVSCTDFVKFMPRYFILVDGMVSGTVSEFQLPIFYMLLIYRKNHMCECICMYVLGWPKSSFRFFPKQLMKNQTIFLANPVAVMVRMCIITLNNPIHFSDHILCLKLNLGDTVKNSSEQWVWFCRLQGELRDGQAMWLQPIPSLSRVHCAKGVRTKVVSAKALTELL